LSRRCLRLATAGLPHDPAA